MARYSEEDAACLALNRQGVLRMVARGDASSGLSGGVVMRESVNSWSRERSEVTENLPKLCLTADRSTTRQPASKLTHNRYPPSKPKKKGAKKMFPGPENKIGHAPPGYPAPSSEPRISLAGLGGT